MDMRLELRPAALDRRGPQQGVLRRPGGLRPRPRRPAGQRHAHRAADPAGIGLLGRGRRRDRRPRRRTRAGLHLVVDDLDAVRGTLVGNGVEVSEVSDMGGGVRYAYFSDPDGNSWALQQISR